MTSICLKKSRFAEDVLFYFKSEVMGFPKIEINEIHVYIKSDAVIRF